MLDATTSAGAFAPPAARKLANAADAKQQRALAHINQGCPDIAGHSDQLVKWPFFRCHAMSHLEAKRAEAAYVSGHLSDR